MGNISITQEKYKHLEKLNELFTYFVIAVGLVLIQLPFSFYVNKNGIYVLAIAVIIFAITWHRLILEKYSGLIKNFIEALVDLTGITILINLTGGTESYFIFLYFLPVLSVTVYMPYQAAFALASLTSFLIFAQTFPSFRTPEFPTTLSIAAVRIWPVWLISAYGRILSGEISIAKKKEEEIKLEEIREVERLREEFLFIISHELRSPITAIRGYLELLISDSVGNLGSKVKAILERAFVTSNKLSNLVSLLLEVARLETGKIHFYTQKVLIKNVFEEVLSNLKSEIKEKNLDVRTNVERTLVAEVDSERLEEILTIAIENAVTYTPEFGKIEVKATGVENKVEIKVSDSGVGIPEEKKEHLFDKFYTEKTGVGDQMIKGVNVSLYVEKQLLLKMGGNVSVESEVGKGTTFTITLPSATH